MSDPASEDRVPDDRLPNHAFYDVLRAIPVDEHGRPVPGPVEPWDIFALGHHRTVDDKVSQALGIPLAPSLSTMSRRALADPFNPCSADPSGAAELRTLATAAGVPGAAVRAE